MVDSSSKLSSMWLQTVIQVSIYVHATRSGRMGCLSLLNMYVLGAWLLPWFSLEQVLFFFIPEVSKTQRHNIHRIVNMYVSQGSTRARSWRKEKTPKTMVLPSWGLHSPEKPRYKEANSSETGYALCQVLGKKNQCGREIENKEGFIEIGRLGKAPWKDGVSTKA